MGVLLSGLHAGWVRLYIPSYNSYLNGPELT